MKEVAPLPDLFQQETVIWLDPSENAGLDVVLANLVWKGVTIPMIDGNNGSGNQGTGNSKPGENTFSRQGLELLADLELPDDGIYKKYYFYDKNGKKIGIKPYLVGDGGITIGYGHYTAFDNVAGLNWLKNKYGIDKNMTQAQLDKIMIPIEDCLNILNNDVSSNATAINNFLKDNKIGLKQNEFDALVINRYNKGHLTQPILDALKSGSRDRKVWENAFYAGLDPKSKYYNGWKKRRQEELEVFLDNDYTRIK